MRSYVLYIHKRSRHSDYGDNPVVRKMFEVYHSSRNQIRNKEGDTTVAGCVFYVRSLLLSSSAKCSFMFLSCIERGLQLISYGRPRSYSFRSICRCLAVSPSF